MIRLFRSAWAYFSVVFALGFALGAARVMLIAPALGEVLAVVLELPVMLAASWWAAGWLVRRFDLSPGMAAPSGALAFVLLMLAELILSLTLFGRTAAEHLATYATLTGGAGLVAQLAFAAAPWIRSRR